MATQFRNKVVKDMTNSSYDWDNPMIGSSWDDIKIVEIKNKDNKNHVGMTINEISKLINTEPIDVVLNLLIEEEGAIKIVFFAMCEEDLINIMKHPLSLFGSDGPAVSPYGEYGELKTHPRYYGTYPRILGKYVREEKIFSLEKAINKMTFSPARKINIKDRGLLKENYKADITIFNKEQIIDKATFDYSHQYPKGIEYVIVNGELVINKGIHTGSLPGRIINRL